MPAKIRDLVLLIIKTTMPFLFTVSGLMKVFHAFGRSAASYSKYHDKFNASVMQTPLLYKLPLSANFFFLIVGLVELTGALAVFVKPKVTAAAFVFVLLGAEYASNAIPIDQITNPMCVDPPAAYCTASSGVHIYFIALSVIMYVFDEPLPSLWRKVQNDFNGSVKID